MNKNDLDKIANSILAAVELMEPRLATLNETESPHNAYHLRLALIGLSQASIHLGEIKTEDAKNEVQT